MFEKKQSTYELNNHRLPIMLINLIRMSRIYGDKHICTGDAHGNLYFWEI